MPDVPEPVSGSVGPIDWALRPEWLGGGYWWRVLVGGHPKVLMRHRDLAMQVAETIAADELQHRRQATGSADA